MPSGRHKGGQRGAHQPEPVSKPGILLCVFLALGLILGGGGSPGPLMELGLQVCAAIALALAVAVPAFRTGPIPKLIIALAAVAVILPAVQLIPLPPAIWHQFPGREAAIAALALVGQSQRWMPISLVRGDTFAALLSFGPPLFVMLYGATNPARGRQLALLTVVAGGLATVVLGAGQLADNGLRLYAYTHDGWITGFQANRNATADILLIALLASAAIAAQRGTPRTTQRVLILVGTMALLTIGIVLTGSRTGIALAVPVILASSAYVARSFGLGWRKLAIGALAAFAVLVAAGAAAMSSPALRRAIDRFGERDDFRWELWTDGWSAALAYWPVGGGMGGFTSLFLPFERLEVVDATGPNRAHNDYLEILIEAGLPGLVALAAALVLLVMLVLRSWKDREVPGAHRFFAIGTILTIAAHAIVDYPLRSMSIACLFALAVAMLAAPSLRQRGNEGSVDASA